MIKHLIFLTKLVSKKYTSKTLIIFKISACGAKLKEWGVEGGGVGGCGDLIYLFNNRLPC